MAKNLKLRDLKKKTPQELLVYAEELGVENASSMRTQDMLFEILKTLTGLIAMAMGSTMATTPMVGVFVEVK